MTDRPLCKCGRPKARRKAILLPGCEPCWAAYLDGHSRDDGESARASYQPPLERDGLLVPCETSRDWQRSVVDRAERLGRKNPFKG